MGQVFVRVSAALLAAGLLGLPAFAQDGLQDRSFESSTAGSPPGAPWVVTSGVAQVRTTPDDLFPSDGAKYLVLSPTMNASGTTGEVRQSFVRPPGAYCALSADWDFITGELPLFSNDVLIITVRDQANTVVATVMSVSSAFVPGINVNVPGGAVSIPNQATLYPSATANPAPAGFKRAWVDLSSLTTAGTTYEVVIQVANGTGMVNTSNPVAYVDNVLLTVADRNSSLAALRVLGSAHTDGTLTSADVGGDLRPETPFFFRTAPGQRCALRASSTPGNCWLLAAGTLDPVGLEVAGYGIVNLDLAAPISIVINGISGTDPLSLLLGTIASGTSLIDLQISDAMPLGTKVALEAAMCSPASATGFDKTATTEIEVGLPQIPVGTTTVPGGANIDDGFTALAIGFSFPFYGTNYSTVYVSSNGNLTFGAGDTDLSETETEMMTDLPRIAIAWDDLFPEGTLENRVAYSQTPGTLTISWTGVREYGSSINGNNFAIQLYSNGVIGLFWGSTTMTDALVGITPGGLTAPGAGVVMSEDLSNSALAFGGSLMAGPGEQFFEQFGLYNAGPLQRDKFDAFTLGSPGPSRMGFQPTTSIFNLIDYKVFTGTR
jgi:hypothetical protein